ncbi:hypothetical protein A5886_002131 [Enterococcus sp. 8G7_MSG3316]|uniref:3-dehydroquinate synthase domain-containing protein n=1 Tax=Candidatus Enterococcus testudinis TaxID=1834191 RepID=A0A242A8J3_9ENTE|nr:hypothetical protein [Enterococcus sp. 8G7_MSG3316]OTN77051.1 hypothetical protein A5886_002131 [Enterococcus sp. 8G7_MSG3316]
MEFLFTRDQQETAILYGETLASVLRAQEIAAEQVIIFTNQRYYDRFYEKLTRLFLPKTVSWYICTNQVYCNNFTEFTRGMDFLGNFPKQSQLLIVGFGNEGIMALSSFIHATAILNTQLWLIPVSLRGLAKSVKDQAIVVRKPDIPMLGNPNTPRYVIYDQTIADKQQEGKIVDFLLLIRCGVVGDADFIKELYRRYPNRSVMMKQSFAAYTDKVIQLYQQQGNQLEEFGQLFTDAFYTTDNGHLLSDTMKMFYGFLFHFIWTVQQQQLTVDLDQFGQWLYHLGYPVALPESFSISDYLANVLDLQKKEKNLLFLSKVGTIGGRVAVNEEDLVKTLMSYEQLIKQIRGN